jgi:hypothetical protein
MTRRPIISLLAAVLGAMLFAAGCGGGSKGSDKAAFCKDNAILNAKTATVSSLAEVAKLFKANVATIDDFGKKAPADIKADAQKLVDAAHKVISTGDASVFADNAVANAGKHVDTYCGQGTTTPTT